MVIRTKRVYDDPDPGDGFRVLVDRLWPRGFKKEQLKADLWLKEAAPSNELRKSFCHDSSAWDVFSDRYFRELDEKAEVLQVLYERASDGVVTLLYAAKDRQYNQAEALKEYLEKMAQEARRHL